MDNQSDKTKTPAPQNSVNQVARSLSAGKQVVVVVSRQPSIDQLTAAIGLASLINKRNGVVQPTLPAAAKPDPDTALETKPNRPTANNAVIAFSGGLPPAIGFLKTDRIVTETIDYYRELIVAINKDLADKLRYSLDKDLAKIHISPFLEKRQALLSKDLKIEHGDFNIDLLVAIGIDQAADLDPIIGNDLDTLKQRQTITLVAGQDKPSQIFGAGSSPAATPAEPKSGKKNAPGKNYRPINWCQPKACCLSEMIFELAQEMRVELDATIATIILTGFLAATERVKSRLADAEQIAMISQLVKSAGIDNKQMIIDYLETKKWTAEATSPAKKAAPALAKKSTAEQLLTEQEATHRIGAAEQQAPDFATRGLGLRVATDRRPIKVDDAKEDAPLTRDLHAVQVTDEGQIVAQSAKKPAKVAPVPATASPASPKPEASSSAPNPIVDADKLGQRPAATIQPAPKPAAISPAPEAAASQQYQPSLIPPDQAAQPGDTSEPNLIPTPNPAG